MSNEVLVNKLVKILKQKHTYDLENLKSDLSVRTDFSNEEVLMLLLKVVEKEIKNYDTDSKKALKCKHIYKCFKYLCMSENLLTIEDYKQFNNKIDLIQQYLFDKKKRLMPNKNCKQFEIDKFLEKISNNLHLVKIRLNEVAINKTSYSKDYVEDNISFINYLIFEVKNEGYIEEIFKTYPQMMYLKIDTDKYIIDDVITKYLEEIHKKNNNKEIVYYQNVIIMMLSSSKFSISKQYQAALIKRLENEKGLLQYQHINKLSQKSQKFFMDEIISFIRNSNIIESDNKAFNINYKYNINPGFSKKVRDEVDELEKNKNLLGDYGIYYDYRDKKVVTIDSDGASVYDDAFSYEVKENGNILLNVYIADVSRYVKKGTSMDKCAFEKTATIYLPDQDLAMLPNLIRNDSCSLNEGTYRYALSHEYEFSPNLDLVNFEIKRVLIKPTRNYTYSSLDYFVQNSKDTKELEYFSNLFNFVSNLKRKNLYNKDYHTIKNMAKQRLSYSSYTHDYANVIQQFMILTNRTISDQFVNNGGLYIYRNNISSIDDKYLTNLNISLNDSDNISAVIATLSKMYVPSYYSTINEGHKGLGLNSYGHNTSPIRRYADLENQRLVKKQLIDAYIMTDREYYKKEEEIKQECTYINERNKLNEQYVKEYIMRLKRS